MFKVFMCCLESSYCSFRDLWRKSTFLQSHKFDHPAPTHQGGYVVPVGFQQNLHSLWICFPFGHATALLVHVCAELSATFHLLVAESLSWFWLFDFSVGKGVMSVLTSSSRLQFSGSFDPKQKPSLAEVLRSTGCRAKRNFPRTWSIGHSYEAVGSRMWSELIWMLAFLNDAFLFSSIQMSCWS